MAGTDRIETQGAEDVPGRHLAAVVVAAERVGLVAVLRLHDLMHAVLRLPRLAGVAVEVDDVMARFVAVPVFADAAVDVGLGRFRSRGTTRSSFSANFSLPPISAIKPGTSCGTYHEYWQLVPSVMSPPS